MRDEGCGGCVGHGTAPQPNRVLSLSVEIGASGEITTTLPTYYNEHTTIGKKKCFGNE